MTLNQLIEQAQKTTEIYYSKNPLGSDEELQMLASAYSVLFLKACNNRPKNELVDAHQKIAECFEKIGDKNWSERHSKLAQAY